MNQRNYGVAEGRLTRDPKVFTNKDGSKKVVLTLATRRNYKGKDGSVDSDFIAIEAFVKADVNGNAVYDHMHKGDLVGIEYTVRTSKYTDEATGEEKYTQVLLAQGVDLKESKAVTTARQSGTQTVAEVPAEAAEQVDTPFVMD